jgi:hypothetical protein
VRAFSVAGMTEQRRGEQPDEQQDAHTGGDATTENQLEADNAVEEDMLKALAPDADPE